MVKLVEKSTCLQAMWTPRKGEGTTREGEKGWKCRRLIVDDWPTGTENHTCLSLQFQGHGRVQSLACLFPFIGCI